MSSRLLFITGHLAYPRLARMIAGFGETARDWRICNIGVKVAALMTQEIILRRLPRPVEADRVVLPGRCRADLAMLSNGVRRSLRARAGGDRRSARVSWTRRRGAGSLALRYAHLRGDRRRLDDERRRCRLSRAKKLAKAGADVIDLGCLPDTPFAHMEETIASLHAAGLKVSVDSADVAELSRAVRAGADHLLSLDEHSLDILPDGSTLVPILVAAPHGDLASLQRAAAKARARKIDFILDPILDPVHFGFADSLARYVELRRLEPTAEIMMGTGNLTELTDADSSGVTAMLLGLCSELNIRHLLTVQVSPHTRRTVEEHDAARRMMFAARADHALPKGYSDALLQIHDKRPYAATPDEIAELARELRDGNFRIEVAEDGVHIFARDFHRVAKDAMSLFSSLGVETDGAHAFYLGTELMKAETAFRLGKRYRQDEPLDFGAACDKIVEDEARFKEIGHTLRKKDSDAADP